MMQRYLAGRAWHGDHLIDSGTPQEIVRLAVVDDGTPTDGGLVHRVREFETQTTAPSRSTALA